MAELNEEDYVHVRKELEAWMDEQDGDLMVAGLAVDVLIAAEKDRRFDQDEQDFLALCLLVNRYDSKRGGGGASKDIERLETWFSESFPDGLEDDHPYAYLLGDPDPGKVGAVKNSTHPDDPHLVERTGWLRAAVLGANDGIVSVSSIIVGVAAADPSHRTVLIAGAAGLAAGAMSMAAGEYVSVSSQADLEAADIEKERAALAANPKAEEAELAAIYRDRGLSATTADLVARELTEAGALKAHIRDELGLTDAQAAQPLLAAVTSAATFSVFAAIPLVAAWLAPGETVIPVVVVTTLIALLALGALGARAGGAALGPAALRVVLWGGLAMAVTAVVGRVFGVAV